MAEEFFGGGSLLWVHADGGGEEIEGEQRPTGVVFVEGGAGGGGGVTGG